MGFRGKKPQGYNYSLTFMLVRGDVFSKWSYFVNDTFDVWLTIHRLNNHVSLPWFDGIEDWMIWGTFPLLSCVIFFPGTIFMISGGRCLVSRHAFSWRDVTTCKNNIYQICKRNDFLISYWRKIRLYVLII